MDTGVPHTKANPRKSKVGATLQLNLVTTINTDESLDKPAFDWLAARKYGVLWQDTLQRKDTTSQTIHEKSQVDRNVQRG